MNYQDMETEMSHTKWTVQLKLLFLSAEKASMILRLFQITKEILTPLKMTHEVTHILKK